MDKFKDAPQSVAEVRAARAGDGRLWTPRDALISTLRDIDSGEINPDVLVVSFRNETSDGTEYGFANASPDRLLSIGLLERVKLIMAEVNEPGGWKPRTKLSLISLGRRGERTRRINGEKP